MAPLHPTYPAFPIMAFLGFIAPLIPLAWIDFNNTGVVLYAIWASLACLDRFINSIVWYGNALNPAPIYCDISSRFFIGYTVALPAASLCIIRRLYLVSSMKYFLASTRQKNWALIQDLSICLGIPIVQMALEYTMEGHRFNIYEDAGCWPDAYNTWPTYLTTFSWPPILGLIGIVYGALVLRIIFRKQRELNEVLTRGSIPRHHYNRLVFFACVPMCFTTPLGLTVVVLNLTRETVEPYKGWADTHYFYSRVDQVPALLWRADPRIALTIEISRWFLVLCSTVFFCFFGFSGEAIKAYKSTFWTLAGYVGIERKGVTMATLEPQRNRPTSTDVIESDFHATSFTQDSDNGPDSAHPNTGESRITFPARNEIPEYDREGYPKTDEVDMTSTAFSSDLEKGVVDRPSRAEI
ncbi:STE3-domain-containing protein [Rickenella mellea]|uniref:STE3-domain-containing protein n=1 Tax=Rickenella mellea TaxID=50990 RepID=A0A4Y7PKH8_9AGAM|nr:STE3-domain-containing protein [Rickenella mellea]